MACTLKIQLGIVVFFILGTGMSSSAQAEPFADVIQPVLKDRCVKCHGANKTRGKINLEELGSIEQWRAKPEVIDRVIRAIDTASMPPEESPPIPPADRDRLLAALKALLADATANAVKRLQPRRLNRFQYNNAVRDLFALKKDLFPLTEKLMTRHTPYLQNGKSQMPDLVQVSCDYYQPRGGLEGVAAYSRDLRASHGFDNQANQLNLSPYLLDSYIRLGQAIVDSPEFTPQTVGIWSTFFAEPSAGVDPNAETRRRLTPFLEQAFRTPVDKDTLERYTAYAKKQRDQGQSFSASMKTVAAAVLCSPRFLFRTDGSTPDAGAFDLASRLSFLLWSSAPDAKLLELAKSGELTRPEILNQTIDRMLADPRIERFLDSFPAQWLQLENLFSAMPDPVRYPQYYSSEAGPASKWCWSRFFCLTRCLWKIVR